MDVLVQFVIDNWKVLFGGGGGAVAAVLLAWVLARWLSGGSKVSVKEVIAALEDRHRDLLREKDDQIRELKKAVEALAERKGRGIRDALAELKEGETRAAEAIFQQVLERKKAEGEQAYKPRIGLPPLGIGMPPRTIEPKKAEGEAAHKEAAAAARHIGALAYLHDTQKALSAYAQAVELDSENPDGWNMLGLLQNRLGNLGSAIKAFERVLVLGNKADDKTVVAMAYGNLGRVYRTRGDLAKAEEYFFKALALNEELGRKEGIANDYLNLGNVYKTRGDLAKACEAWAKSRRLFEEVGAAPNVAKVQALMEEAGCG